MASQMWMTGHVVELPEMLNGREKRAQKQRMLHSTYPGTLVCFTLNIAGPIKVFALSMEVFENTDRKILEILRREGFGIRCHEMDTRPYGWESYIAVDGDPMEVKKALLELEEKDPAGRLFDIDVLCADGTKVSREDFGMEPRACLICGEPTIACARSRAHTVAQLQDKTTDIFLQSLKGEAFSPKRIGRLCGQAMLLEVYTTPKPGLVDRNNTGSHKDMNVETFERSTEALIGYFTECAEAGMIYRDTQGENLLSVIRPLGICAEKAMLHATGGINTHKGMIFSMGILACAAGWVLCQREIPGEKSALVSRILEIAGLIAYPAWTNDMSDLEKREQLTAGELQFKTYGIGGIRREAAMGYPSVRELAWPKFLSQMEEHGQWELAGMRALMELVANVTDTNIIHRSSVEVQEQIHRQLAELLHEGELTREQVLALDEQFIGQNISPGGCADLLALTYFLYEIAVMAV